jgi:membrane protein required for colicin V production
MERDSMQAYDVLMLIVLGLAIAWGAWKGLAWQIASIASIGLSYFVALRFRQPLAGVINASPPWNVFLSMLILFLGTGLIVWIGFNLVRELIERVKLKEFDRQLGALFGAAKGVLLCVLMTLFSVALLGDAQRQAICNSKSGYYIAVLLDRADMIIPRELHDVLAPYIDRFDRSVPHSHSAGGSSSLPAAISEVENRFREATQPQPAAWQRELEAVFGGQSPSATPPLGPSFPTGGFQPPPAPLATPQTAGRIEASPALPPPEGSFRQR